MERQHMVTWEDPRASTQQALNMSGLDFLHAMIAGEIPPPPIARLMNMELVSVERGAAIFKLNVAEYHYNPIGSVHGGVISTILDSGLGCAVQTTLPAGIGYTTTQLNVNLVRALRLDVPEVWCHANIVHEGRRTATAEARLQDADGKLYAHGTTTCLIFEIPT